jgi:uncharacterized protein
MDRLQLSRHLEIVPRQNDFAVYHKLFGNLCLLDNTGLELLRSFAEPQDPLAVDLTSSPNLRGYLDELCDRFFLVPEGSDEREVVEEDKVFREQNLESGYLLKGIQLVLADDCNLGCSYCFQSTIPHTTAPQKSLLRVLPSKEPLASTEHQSPEHLKRMSAETAILAVRNAIEVARNAGHRHLGLEFFGGEPLLNWSTIEAVLDEFGTGEKEGVTLHYSITTNATKATDEIARKLRQYNVTVTVSFDSPKNVERVTKRGMSADPLIHQGLEILSRNDSILTFNTVVSVDNVDFLDIEGLLEVAQYHKVRQIGVILDLAIKPYEDKVRMKKVVDTVMLICERAKECGIAITGYWHQIFEQIIGVQMINLQKGYKTCAAEGCKLSFEPNGNITNCKTGEKPIGHASAVGEVFKTPWYKKYAMKAYETTPYCRGCAIEGFCSGLCMGTIQKAYNDVNVLVAPACDVYRDLTQQLIQAVPDHQVERLYLSSVM